MLSQLAHGENLTQFCDQAAVSVQLISTNGTKQPFFQGYRTFRTTTERVFFSPSEKTPGVKIMVRMFLPFCNFSQATRLTQMQSYTQHWCLKGTGNILHLHFVPGGCLIWEGTRRGEQESRKRHLNEGS